MPASELQNKQTLLESVLRLAGQRLQGAAAVQAREFLTLYYDQVDAEDLAARAPEDLYGAGMTSHASVNATCVPR